MYDKNDFCHTYGWTDGRTEFLPILQDFVPSRGRCPATLSDFSTTKKQGKGTADHMMPFGDWLTLVLHGHDPGQLSIMYVEMEANRLLTSGCFF